MRNSHLLYSELEHLAVKIIHRICREVRKPSEVLNSDNLLPLDEIVLSNEVLKKLASVGPRDALEFRKKVREHYIAAYEHLIEKTALNSSKPQYLVKNFRFLLPNEIKNHKKRNIEDMLKIIDKLPLSIPSDEATDELRLLQCEVRDMGLVEIPTVDYWRGIISQSNLTNGEKKFPHLSLLAKVSFIVYHGSADIERSFSESGNMLAENQANMSVEFLNAKLNVRSALQQYNYKVESITITPDLLKRANAANAAYKAYLQEKREKEELAKKNSEEEKRMLEEEEQRRRDITEYKKSLEDLEKYLKLKRTSLAEKRKPYCETITLGNKKLKKALDKKDMIGACSAQAIIQGAEHLKDEENALLQETSCLDKKISKLKDKLIKTI